jgi:two-component system LytT family response regulator
MEANARNPAASGGRRVLIVDDMQTVRHFLKTVLARFAPELVVAGEADSVDGALALILATRPDVVVLGTDIIGGSGMDVCAELPQSPPLWVFLCASGGEAEACRRIPGARVLMKPFELDALIAAVRD